MKRTSENFLIERQLKSGELLIKQKARHRPYQLQSYVEKEINKLVQSEHLEKMQNIEEHCLVSAVILTMKKSKVEKIALGSRKVNDSCIKKKPHSSNAVEILNQISTELTRVHNKSLWISKNHLKYAYGQLILHEKTISQ